MCYLTILSTTSPADLTAYNSPLLVFSKETSHWVSTRFLRYPNHWFLESKDGCSCSFRHLGLQSLDLGFADPADWWPEEIEDIDATRQVYRVINHLLEHGFQVDCVDAWDSGETEPNLAGDITIDFNVVPESSFRFFEWYRFEFSNRHFPQ